MVVERLETRTLLAGDLTVTLPTSGWEGQTLSAASSVRIATALATPLVVSLQSSDTSELTVPATVTIAAGRLFANFTVSLKTDGLKDHAQTASVIANATDYNSGSLSMTVRDADLDHVVLDPISGPKTVAVQFTATARAYNIDNEQVAVSNDSLTLTATGSSGSVLVAPAGWNFNAGAWSGKIAIYAVDPAVTVQLAAGNGISTSSNSFAVQAGSVSRFEWGAISSPQNPGQPFNASLVAKDANGYIANGFNGTATLAGQIGTPGSATVFNNPGFSGPSTGTYTWAYQFTPSVNVQVTHVRSFFGSKVSIWTQTGNLIASQPVNGVPGNWTETALASPVTLEAGQRYRVGAYVSNGPYYLSSTTTPAFSWGTFNFALYSTTDAWPTGLAASLGMVDLRVNVGSTVPVTPTNATFVNGTWSGAISVAQQAKGMHLHVDDGAGHVGDSANFDVTDATAPTSVDLASVSDVGATNFDNITSLNNSSAAKTLQFSVAGTVVGATVTLYADGNLIGSAVATSTTTTITTNGTTLLSEGAHSMTARQAAPGGLPSLESPALSITVDTIAPPAPGAPDLQTASDSGSSSTDNLTKVKTPILDVANVSYFRLAKDGVQISGNYQFGAYTTPSLADGVYAFTAASVDAAGNVSSFGPALSVKIDSVALTPPIPDLNAGDDTGFSESDNITSISGARLDLNAPEAGVLHFRVDGIERTISVPAGGSASALLTSPPAYISSSVTTGTAIWSLAVADFNGDGKLDLVGTAPSLKKLIVNLGIGDGMFGAPIITTQSIETSTVAAADFNRDGKMDVVFTARDNSAHILLGDGDGTFTNGPTVPMNVDGWNEDVAATGDLNNDGNPDIVVSLQNYQSVAVMLGNGNGTFQTSHTYFVGGWAYAPTIADVNNDGKMDVVVSAQNSTYHSSILLGDGNGNLSAPIAVGNTISWPASYAVADFNKDGKLDLMSADSSGTVSLFKGNGNGTFSIYAVIYGNRPPHSAAAGDFDGDGNIDFAVASDDSPSILTVFPGNGNGTFKPAIAVTTGYPPAFTRTGDFDGDGRADLALPTYSSGVISVVRYNPGTILDGTHTAVAWLEDLAGNVSANSATLSILIDTIAPAAPGAPTLDPASDSGIDDADRFTNVATPTLNLDVAAPYFRVYRGNTLTSQPYESGNAFVLPDQESGTWFYSAEAVDAAGNVSSRGDTLAVIIDRVAPTQSITPINPNPRTQSFDSASIVFSERVYGLTLFDLQFTRNGSANLLTDQQTLTTIDHVTWTLSNLAPLTGNSGDYTLSITPPPADTTDRAGNAVANTSSLTITRINTAPTFAAGTDIEILEDSNALAYPQWATNLSAGTESGQALDFIVSTDNDALFETPPAISADGSLTFKPLPNAYGVAVVSVQLHDDGGTDSGGEDTSAIQTFSINITPINDTPTFMIGGEQNVDEDSGTQVISGWATNISAGPANESSQALHFELSSDHPELFADAPSIDPATGALTYTPAANVSGSAAVSVRLVDDGGSEHDGIDASAWQNFMIEVNAVADAPSLSVGSASGNETAIIPLPIAAGLTDLDGSESLQLTIGGVPLSAILSAGINNGGGNWTLTPAQLAGLTITNPDNLYATLTITATASETSNGDSASSTAYLPLVFNNVNPAVSATSLAEAVRGQSVLLKLAGSDLSPTDKAAGFTYTINWGDGSTPTIVPRTANNASVSANHVYTANGNYTIAVTCTDKDGGKATATKSIKISAVAMEADPANPAKRTLFVGGTTGRDKIQLIKSGKSQVQVKIGGVSQGIFTPDGQIIVFAQAGDDDVTADNGLPVITQIYGGDGNDVLSGGTILVGEAGNDTLHGSSGRDILIGGTGADRLDASAGDDLLIAGSTAFDAFPANQPALAAIRATWNSSAIYALRVLQLSVVGPYRLDRTTVFNDSAIDSVAGSSGSDWFLQSSNDRNDRNAGEILTLV